MENSCGLNSITFHTAGGMAGGAAGTSLAVAGCVLFGVATGDVGLFICGLAGGIAGGALGSTVAGSLARGLREGEDGPPCPSCHSMQREWEASRSFGTFAGVLDPAPLGSVRRSPHSRGYPALAR